MSMETMYNDQMVVMKQMVAEMKQINSNLLLVVETVKDSNKAVNPLEFLTEVLGGFGIDVNGNELAVTLDDDDYFNDECTWGYDDDDDWIEELADVAEEHIDTLLTNYQLPFDFFGSKFYGYDPDSNDHDVDFKTNELEGTTVAYLYISGKFVKKGVSKCHPEDVFIPEVGEAIALYRLFDLQVPDSLLQK